MGKRTRKQIFGGCCVWCGQQMRHRDLAHLVSGKRREIYVAVSMNPGIRTDQLFDKIYPAGDGGPLSGNRIIAVHVDGINKVLRRFGQRIAGGRRGPKLTTYVLEETEPRVSPRPPGRPPKKLWSQGGLLL